MFRLVLLLAALTLAGPTIANAQSAPANSPAGIASSFFATLQTGDAAKAYADIWRDTLMQKKQVEVENIANQTASALKLFGKMLGWETIQENKITENFYENTYMVRTEQAPVFFKMEFYRAQTRWVATNVYFTDTYKNVAP